MPEPRLITLADTRYVFACIHDRAPRGGCGWYGPDGRYHPVTNLDWLLRHSHETHDLWVSTGRYKSLAMGGGPPYGRVDYESYDAILAVRLTGGRVYVTTWQSRTLLREWLKRPKFLGRAMHWECRTVVIGAPNYEEVCR